MKRLYILLLLVLTLFGCSTNREITDRKEIHFWGKTFFYLQKYDKAISILKDAAEKDYVPAQYDLGIIYLYIRKDYAKAYYWLNEAASQYYSPAQYFMGTLYEQGLGFEKNEKKAVEWYEKASNPTPEGPYRRIPKFDRKWSAQAKYKLGMICFREGNYEKAFEWFHSAARQKNDSAMFQLGMMYEEGIGIHKDNKKAAYYYSKVARIDHFWYYGANPGKNGSHHVGMIKAPKSHRDAQYRYARMCHDGRIGFHNYTMARKFYQKAASSGHAQAQRELGLMYKRGQGSKQDRQQALQWLSKAAQQGDAEAQYHTAVLLEQEKDSTQALELYRKSWENGYKVNESMLKKRGIILPDSNNVSQLKTKRMALLIGNDDYPDDILKNPRNDVWSLKQTLNSLGFETRLFINLKSKAMRDSIQSFYNAATNCEATLFYFAGHGSQENNENYLYPARINGTDINDCITLNSIINQLDNGGDQHNIVIIDACRLPSKRQKLSIGTGLPKGLFLSLSTDIDNVAEDGYNRLHSPYLEALLHNLSIPGLNIIDIMQNTKSEVENKSNGYQVPSNFNNLYKGDKLILNKVK